MDANFEPIYVHVGVIRYVNGYIAKAMCVVGKPFRELDVVELTVPNHLFLPVHAIPGISGRALN